MRRHGTGPAADALGILRDILHGSRMLRRPAALPANDGASALDLAGERNQFEALSERRTLGTAYRLPMSSGSIQGPGRQLARGCLVGNAEFWQRGGPRHGPHLPCGRCMPWATVSWTGVQALELDPGS